jgi:NifB/MoaA-like Fe-S oxidoreductase
LRIDEIRAPSPASRAGLRKHDELLTCQGYPVDDWIDFAFRAHGSRILVECSRGGRIRRTELTRSPGSNWGMSFVGQSPRSCRRHCVFCFVDQNPPGVRDTLRVKDDDVRYSFYQGTFVTLGPGDIRLAMEKRLSPIHVSVHSTDPDTRGRLLGMRGPEPILPQLMELSDAGISIEAQVVIVPGWNDGCILRATLDDLSGVPGVASVGVVPVGLTSHRAGLAPISRPSREQADEAVSTCESFRERVMAARGTYFVFPSDELMVLAGREIPGVDYYEGCGMKADGIGMLAGLMTHQGRIFHGEGEVCTGSVAAPFMRKVLAGSNYGVLEVVNGFFGPDVGVSGLLSGEDIVATARKSGASDGFLPLVLPAVMFNHDGVTVDDMTPETISRAAGRPVKVAGGIEELP